MAKGYTWITVYGHGHELGTRRIYGSIEENVQKEYNDNGDLIRVTIKDDRFPQPFIYEGQLDLQYSA